MINTTITAIKKHPVNPYPVLKISKYGTIILFNDRRTGIVVSGGAGSFPIGRYCTDWTEEFYTQYADAVTLVNA